MGQRASHEDDVFHIGEAEICDELTTATEQPIIFLADETCSDALFLHRDLVQAHGKISLPNHRHRQLRRHCPSRWLVASTKAFHNVQTFGGSTDADQSDNVEPDGPSKAWLLNTNSHTYHARAYLPVTRLTEDFTNAWCAK